MTLNVPICIMKVWVMIMIPNKFCMIFILWMGVRVPARWIISLFHVVFPKRYPSLGWILFTITPDHMNKKITEKVSIFQHFNFPHHLSWILPWFQLYCSAYFWVEWRLFYHSIIPSSTTVSSGLSKTICKTVRNVNNGVK